MGHILRHGRLRMNNDALHHLAIMFVNKSEKKWKRAEMEDH